MNELEKISIIVPVYNASKFLRKCLNSCINQTHKNVEIICINDHSTDSSLNILNEYASKNLIKLKSFIKNHGVSFARNFGLDMVSPDSKYVAFVDSDDFIAPTFCEKLYKSIQTSDLSCCGNNNVSESYGFIRFLHVPQLEWSDHPMRDRKFFSIYRTVSKKLFKLDIIRKHHLRFMLDIHYGEDAIFFMKYLTFCKSISGVKEPLYNVVRNKQSLCRNPIYKARRKQNMAKSMEIMDNIEKEYFRTHK